MKIEINIKKKNPSYKKRIKMLDKFLSKMEKKGFTECKCKDNGIEIKDHFMHVYNSGILEGHIFNSPIYKIYFYCNQK